MLRFLAVVGVVLTSCREETRPPALPSESGVAPGQKGSWVANGRRYTGVREVENPPPPGEAWVEPKLDAAPPTRLAGFSAAEPGTCADVRAVPDAAQWASMLSALAAEPAPTGVFEVVALADGCARLVEYRAAGTVQRWELRRFGAAGWEAQITWDFDPGVARPSTIDRFSLTEPLNRFGEWAKGEVHRKRFVANGERVFTHYRGEPAVYAVEPGAPPRRVSSDTPTSSCRLDGSNHCDRPEEQRRWRFDPASNPY